MNIITCSSMRAYTRGQQPMAHVPTLACRGIIMENVHFEVIIPHSLTAINTIKFWDLPCARMQMFIKFFMQNVNTKSVKLFGESDWIVHRSHCSAQFTSSLYRPGVGNLLGMKCHFLFFWLTTVSMSHAVFI